MTRKVEMRQETFIVHLSGITSLAALKRNIAIPYKAIVRVTTEPPNLNSLIRFGGTAIGHIQEGHFWHGEDWYFLSYEHRDKVISLTLDDYHIGDRVYKVVAVEVDDPHSVKTAIEARLENNR